MPITCKDHFKIYQHILKAIWDEDEKSPLHLALEPGTFFKTIQDLVNLPDQDIDRMTYEIDEDTQPLAPYYQRKLKTFREYVRHVKASNSTRLSFSSSDPWLNISKEDYDNFRVSPDYQPVVSTPDPKAPRSNSNAPSQLDKFEWGIKRDQSLYPKLTRDKDWDSYRRATKAQAFAQGTSEVLDPKYKPTTADEKQVFDKKQKFMYAVALNTLLTNLARLVLENMNMT